MPFEVFKLCNDVLTRVRQPGPPAGPGWAVPKTYIVGDTITKRPSLVYRIRHFELSGRGHVYAYVHLLGQSHCRTAIWIGDQADIAERLVLGERVQ